MVYLCTLVCNGVMLQCYTTCLYPSLQSTCPHLLATELCYHVTLHVSTNLYVRFTLSFKALIQTFRELWMRCGSTNVDIHTLVWELWEKVRRYNFQKSWGSWELTIGFCLRTEQECAHSLWGMIDKGWWKYQRSPSKCTFRSQTHQIQRCMMKFVCRLCIRTSPQFVLQGRQPMCYFL